MPSGIGTMVAVIGAAIGGAGTLMEMKAQKDQAAASQKAESAREKQMNLEAARQRRKVAREAQRRRAEVQANGTNQGVQQSSGVIGGVQQITSDETMQRRDVNEGQTYGAQVFKANRQASAAGAAGAFGSGMQSLGKGLVGSSATFQRLGTYVLGK